MLVNILKQIHPIALEAGEIIQSFVSKDKEVHSKSSAIDFVTIADKKTEEFLVSKLSKINSNFNIQAEEGTMLDNGGEYTWVIDPLDGTVNFARGIEHYCVSIGLVDVMRNPVLGVVYNPISREYFSACKNEGAYLDNKKIFVSKEKDTSKAIIATGFPYNKKEVVSRLASRIEKALSLVGGLRRLGSAALDICFTACGRFDGYFEESLKPWDVSGALIILREAGGLATDFSGENSNIDIGDIIACNQYMHDSLMQIVNTRGLAGTSPTPS